VNLVVDELRVHAGRPLVGTVVVPGDKSISHRALLIGSVAEGISVARGLSDGGDVARTEAAVKAYGVTVERSQVDGTKGPATTTIHGGAENLVEPRSSLDCGNSGTTMRLIAGLLAARPWNVELVGDASLSMRPMDRVAEPLRLMGATVTGRGTRCQPPLAITGGQLQGIEYAPPQASSQVKSCVLLAGLVARGGTVVREAVPTRRHTEELLGLCGADIEETTEDGAHVVRLRSSTLRPFDLTVPGDPSQAAFWVVAGCVVPGSEIRLPGVYVGEGRRGFLDVFARMGADVTESEPGDPGTGKASADLVARYGPLVATEVSSAEITGLDEVPVLAVAASVAAGTTVFRDMAELRVKESDRMAGIVRLLAAFGGRAEVQGDDLFVHGGARLTPAEFHASGDHRMAMAAAVAAATASDGATSLIRGWESVETSYPSFSDDLAGLAGDG
jgi:3-phosphoshikimate 1-carboxyvinyltransferase